MVYESTGRLVAPRAVRSTVVRGARSQSLLHSLLSGRVISAAVAIALAGLAGAATADVMPRGPVTTAQALGLMALGLFVGVAAGVLLRTRWAMLLAPALNMLAFEAGRQEVTGPTVDGIHLDTTFGIVAFVLGRGVYALIALMPMALGAVYGAALARRLWRERRLPARRRFGFYLRRATGSLATLGMIGLAVLIAWPPSVPPVRGADGDPVPGSIAEIMTVELGGHEQAIYVRAANPDAPVLLWLAGGPGQSDLPFARTFFDNLSRDFVLVDWDQRGAGKSYPALDPAETWTLAQAVSDTIELTNDLRERFDEEKVYLAGVSWGSTLGVLAVQQRPDLYHAFIGTGQMVSQLESDRRIYQALLAYAAESGDESLAEKLRGYGEPPYDDPFAYAFVMQNYEKIEPDYTPPAAYENKRVNFGMMGERGSEYSFIEKINALRGFLDMGWTMYPQLWGLDFRRDVPRLEVPVYFLDGEAELAARRDLFFEWYGLLDAPSKQLFTLPNASHSVAYEQFEEFHRIMVEIVVPETYPAPPADGTPSETAR
jgi:pimeloyl-ACP methyl ester carboxylesterase